MKKTLSLMFCIAGLSSLASASTVLVTFGNNGGVGQTTFSDSYDGQSATWNRLNTGNNYGESWNGLVDTTGAASSIGIAVNGPICGSGGMTNTITGDTSGLYNVFGETALTGTNGGTANDGKPTTITFSNLTIGQSYTFTLFTGRGNSYGGIYDAVYSFGNGADVTDAQVLSYFSEKGTTPSIDDNNAITAATGSNLEGKLENTNNNWMLAQYTFTATDTTAVFNSTGDSGNFAAFAITANAIPEPATASLGILALTSLMLRRRKA